MPQTGNREIKFLLLVRGWAFRVWLATFCAISLLGFSRLLMGGALRKSTVNIESGIAVAFVLTLVFRSREQSDRETAPAGNGATLWLCWLPVIVLPFLLTIGVPFLFDSYGHVVKAATESGRQVLAVFVQHPTSGDFFFRPLGYLDYWLEARWAGFSFVAWHSDGIVLHLAASALLYLLCRRLGLPSGAACVSALLFGLHAGNAEVVSWTASRFDELCTCFTVATLILVLRYVDAGTGLALMLLLALSAMLSKEAGFCLPALAVCVLVYRQTPFSRRAITAVSGLALLAAGTLMYRFWVLGGVGGYGSESGDPTALHFHALRFLELISFRMWSVLLFPVNWSRPLEWWAASTAIIGLIAPLALLAAARPCRRKILAAIAFCILALLPAQHLALLDATMLGTRVYHLPLLGLALLFGAVADSLEGRKVVAAITTGSFLLLQTALLCHNLILWRTTAQLAGQVCANFPKQIHLDQPVAIADLPAIHDGVFFLANAFSACVLVNSGKEINLVRPSSTLTFGKANLQRMRWDSKCNCISKDRGPEKGGE